MKAVKFLWNALGTHDVWTALLVMVFVVEIVRGFTLLGGYWLTVCLMATFLSKMAESLELIAENKTIEQEGEGK